MRFGIGDGPAPTKMAEQIADALVSGRLPGVWGLLQRVVETWSEPTHNADPRAVFLRRAINTAGHCVAYYRTLYPEPQDKPDPLRQWLAAEGLGCPGVFHGLDHLVYLYLLDLPRRDRKVGTDTVRTFTLPGAPSGAREVHYSFTGDGATATRFLGTGPFLPDTPEAIEALRSVVADLVYQREGGADLELSVQRDENGYQVYQLASIGVPDEYVGPELDRIVHRIERFRAHGIGRKVLLHGAPGGGKTSLARSLARRIGSGRALRIEGDALSSTGPGFVTRFLRLLRPEAVLFDDMDRSSETTAELLHYLEGASEAWFGRCIVLGTANAIEALDPALLRPGRFDEVHAVGEPSAEARTLIVQHYARRHGVDPAGLVEAMEGFSPADIREAVVSIGALGPASRDAEVARVREQRALHAGDRVAAYLRERAR